MWFIEPKNYQHVGGSDFSETIRSSLGEHLVVPTYIFAPLIMLISLVVGTKLDSPAVISTSLPSDLLIGEKALLALSNSVFSLFHARASLLASVVWLERYLLVMSRCSCCGSTEGFDKAYSTVLYARSMGTLSSSVLLIS